METTGLVAGLLSMLLLGLAFWFLPVMKGPDAFFGVPVSEDFYHSRRARALLRRYRAALLLLFAPALMALGLPGRPALGPVLMSVACLGALGMVAVFHRRLRPLEAVAPLPQATAALRPRWAWQYVNTSLELVCLALLGLTVAALWARPDLDPNEARGVAMLVFSQAYLFVLMLAFLPGIAQARMWLPAEGTAEFLELREQYMSTLVGLLYFLKVTVMLLFCGLAWALERNAVLLGLTWSLQGVMVVGTVGYCLRMLRQRRRLRALAGPGSLERAAPTEGWIGGMIYYHPQDPSLIVEKRIGIGWTFNFAHPITWLWMVLLIVGPLLAAWLFHR